MNFHDAAQLIQPHLDAVETRIRAQAHAFDSEVAAYISYVCANGGKRLRPVMALLAGGAAGGVRERHVDLAIVVELIHMATLVHDDIIDEADLRRGSPTANAKWGNALSVLVGDALFAQALRLSTVFETTDTSRRIADATAEVCTGEIMQSQRRFDPALTIADYLTIIEKKTASLFAIAAEMAAAIAEAPPAHARALKTYGTKFGTAFQIYDDILDFSDDETAAGKTLGTDFHKGKFTLPILLMLAQNPSTLTLLTRDARFDAIREAITSLHRPLSESHALARRYLAEAREALAALPETPYREALAALADSVNDRLAALPL